jgi:phage terminase large subunit-like protein
VKAACARHLDDLTRQGASHFPYYFDASEAATRIALYRLCRHVKGEWAGQPIELQPWQQFVVGAKYGWKRSTDHLRRFRVAYNELTRATGKSTLGAGDGLTLTFFDGEPGAIVVSVATKKDQTRIVFGDARQMVLRSPKLRQRIQVLTNSLFDPRSGSRFEALGADADTMDGLRLHGAIVDEVHAHRTRAVVDVVDSSTGGRRQPMIVYYTTAGADRLSVCWSLREYTRQILDGTFADESWFGFIACAKDTDDPFDPRTWRKANLSLGVSVKLDDLQRKADVARRQPAALNEFLRKHLNVWTSVTDRFFDTARWAECRAAVADADLVGTACFGGLDLGLSDDFSAFALVWPIADGRFAVRMRFWIPQGALERFPNRPYAAWARAGALVVTDGDTADLDRIEDEVRELCAAHGVRAVAFDKRFASQLALHLQGAGVTMVDTPQGFQLNEALRKVSSTVADGALCHGNDPVLAWMASNAQVRTGWNGELRLDKERSADKIDGIAALTMAFSRVLAQPVKQASVYDDPDFDPRSVWL